MKFKPNHILLGSSLVLVPALALASIPTEASPSIQSAIDMLVTGHYGALIIKSADILGNVAVILTAAAFSVQTFCSSVGKGLNKVGLNNIADKIKVVSDKVFPYIAYLSLYNVQKGRNVQAKA